MRAVRGAHLAARVTIVCCVLAWCAGAGAAPDPAAPPALRLGNGEKVAVRVAAPSARLDQTFLLVPKTRATRLKDLTVRVDLADGDRRLWPVGCSVDDNPCGDKLGDVEQAVLRVVADLPATGAYTGTITVTAPAAEASGEFALTVDRALAPLGLEVSGVAPKLGRYCPLPACDDFVDIWVALNEVTGNDLDLIQPSIVALAFKGANDARYQSAYHLRVLDEEGREIGFPLHLSAGETRKVRLRVEGIDGAGDYAGKVRWSARGKGRVDVDFSAVVKEPWIIAFLFILLGVLVGEGMRQYRRVLLPRLEARQELLRHAKRCLEDLSQPVPASRRAVAEALRERVEDALELLDRGGKLEEPLIEQLALYRKWSPLHDLVEAMPEAKRAAFKAPLDAARAALMDAPDKSAVTAAGKGLDAVDEQIRAQGKEVARARIDALIDSLDEIEQVSGGDPAEVTATREALGQARVKLEADERAAAAALYDEAALRYARLAAGALEREAAATPAAILPPDRSRLQAELAKAIEAIEAATEPASAIAALAEARRIWIRGQAEGLRQIVKDDPKGSPERATITGHLDAVDRGLAAGDLESAQQALRLARETYNSIKGGFQGDKAPPLPARLAELVELVLPAKAGKPSFGARLRSVGAKRAFFGFWYFLASVAIATLSGMQVLWVNDATWGGWAARVLALFWGLGLHQVSGALVQGGVDAVRAKLDGSTT